MERANNGGSLAIKPRQNDDVGHRVCVLDAPKISSFETL